MKSYFVVAALVIAGSAAAQTSSVSIRQNFNEISKLGRVQGGESLQNFSSNNVRGFRYFPETWQPGSIVATSGEIINNAYLLLLDKQTHDLYVKELNGSNIVLLDKGQVKRFSIGNHTFVSGASINGDASKYYELLAGKEGGIGLFKCTDTKFIKANRQDAERIKSGNFDDEYRDNVTYFIKTAGTALQKIKLNEHSLEKALPGNAQQIKSYSNSHSNAEQDETFFASLVQAISQ